jgi:Uma2 family endonuclease
MAETATVRHTLADYEALPEGAPYQLIEGELVMSPAPTPYHQYILFELAARFRDHVRDRQIGKIYVAPLDVYLSEEDVFQPDILFISRDRAAIVKEKNVQGAPDLIVEVLPLSTSYYDLSAKKRTYEAAGVWEYWIVDPMAKRIEVYESREHRFELASEAAHSGMVRSKVMDGFSVDVAEVFNPE